MSSNCSTHIALHKQKGSNQDTRFLDALKPSYAKIDDRTLQDLILFTAKLSNHIKFYSLNNIDTGNWSSFFENDVTFILCKINAINVTKLRAQFLEVQREFLLTDSSLPFPNSNIDPLKDELDELVDYCITKVNSLPDTIELKAYFLGTKSKLQSLKDDLISEINVATELKIILQNHLFVNKFNALLGLLNEWKLKSITGISSSLKNYASHTPQYALFLSFLQLFEEAQKELNTFTKRHLEFYYSEVLGLNPKTAEPDNVHLCIEPQKNERPFLIPKNTIFPAGNNPDGKKSYYTSLVDTAINQSKINTVFSVHKANDQLHSTELTELNGSGESFPAFNNETIAEVGFAIASPLFLLQSGTRSITLKFYNGTQLVNSTLSDFKFEITSEKDWVEISPTPQDLIIKPEDDAIIGFNSELHSGQNFDTRYPILKIIPLDLSKNISFTTIEVTIDVINCKHFKLFSQTGEVDINEAFYPFGEFPQSGMSMLFTSNEFFQKRGASGTFNIESNEASIDNITDIRYLQNGIWSNSIGNTNDIKSDLSLIPNTLEVDGSIAQNSKSGFLKIELNGVDYNSTTFLKSYLNAIKPDKIDSIPIAPKIESFTFNYNATQSFGTVSKEDYHFFEILPQGYKKPNKTETLNITPTIKADGNIYIGFNDVEAGNVLSMLIQVLDGSANPLIEPVEPIWEMLINNKWATIERLSDNSLGLTQSGIVTFKVPEDFSTENQTQLADTCFWIRIGISEHLDGICNVLGLHTQALKAELIDFDNNGLNFLENIASGTISKLHSPLNAVKKVAQLYPSFGGKTAEIRQKFYQRSSERLRHKDKAITLWDYEKLILENYPQVHQVKCLNHYKYYNTIKNSLSAGYVTIIPTAKGSLATVSEYWKPLVDVSTMKSIQQFLKQKSSPHVRINVKAPLLEEIRLQFNIKFKDTPGSDTTLLMQNLKETIKYFLSPWLKQDNVVFGGIIQQSEIIKLLDQQDYVDYISNFKILHVIPNTGLVNTVDDIIPSTEYSLLIPGEHHIDLITEKCQIV